MTVCQLFIVSSVAYKSTLPTLPVLWDVELTWQYSVNGAIPSVVGLEMTSKLVGMLHHDLPK